MIKRSWKSKASEKTLQLAINVKVRNNCFPSKCSLHWSYAKAPRTRCWIASRSIYSKATVYPILNHANVEDSITLSLKMNRLKNLNQSKSAIRLVASTKMTTRQMIFSITLIRILSTHSLCCPSKWVMISCPAVQSARKYVPCKSGALSISKKLWKETAWSNWDSSSYSTSATTNVHDFCRRQGYNEAPDSMETGKFSWKFEKSWASNILISLYFHFR